MKQRHYTIIEAQSRLSAIVNRINEESEILLTNGGKPVAVLLSVNEYRRRMPLKDGFWERFMSFRNMLETEGIVFDEHDFRGLRDSSEGREIEELI